MSSLLISLVTTFQTYPPYNLDPSIVNPLSYFEKKGLLVIKGTEADNAEQKPKRGHLERISEKSVAKSLF